MKVRNEVVSVSSAWPNVPSPWPNTAVVDNVITAKTEDGLQR